MYTVIGAPTTRAFRVMWMLEELRKPYTIEPLRPGDPAIAAVNPSLKVPVLKDGNAIIIDSVAICQYLADKHLALTFPAGTVQRAQQDSFTMFAVDDVESGLWQNAKHTFVLPEEYRVPAAKRAFQYDFDRSMQALSQRLGTNKYVTGDWFTVPDLLLGYCGMWARMTGWTIPEGNVADYMARIRARPAYEAAQARRKAG